MVNEEVKEVKVSELRENEFNPNEMDEGKLAVLRASLEKDGQQQPIIVRPMGDLFEIIDGAHRVRVAKALKWKSVRVVVQEADDATAMRLCYTVNEARGNLDFFKEALFFKQLKLVKEVSTGKIAEEYGVSENFGERLVKSMAKQAELTAPYWLVYAGLSIEERVVFCAELKQRQFSHSVFAFKRIAERVTREVKEKHRLQAVVEKTEFKVCPNCESKAVGIDCNGNLRCAKWHDWNPKSGKSSQKLIEKTYDKTVEKKSKSLFPRTYHLDGKFDEIIKAVTGKLVAVVGDLVAIEFTDKDGVFYKLRTNGSRMTMYKGKNYYDAEAFDFVENDKGKVELVTRASPLNEKSDAAVRELAAWAGVGIVEKKKKGACAETGEKSVRWVSVGHSTKAMDEVDES